MLPICRARARFPNLRRSLLTLSSVEGPTQPPLVTSTLSEYFASEILAKHAARPALICRSEAPRAHGGPPSKNLGVTKHLAWDFEEFDHHVKAMARGMIAMGVKKGERVGVIMGNNSSYATLQWACARIGAILVTINPAYRLSELIATLNLVSVSHLFLAPSIRTSHYTFLLSGAFPALRDSSPGAIDEPALPALRNIVIVNHTTDREKYRKELHGLKGTIDCREIMMWREDGREVNELKEIGAPKAVSLTHFNLLNNGISIGRCMRLTPQDVLCNVPPLFHCFGLVLGNLAAWSHGACIVYPSPLFDPPQIIDAVLAEKCTALHGVPTHFLGVLGEVEKRQKAGTWDSKGLRLRTGIAAGSSVPIELMERLGRELGLDELTNAYGMTETSPVSFQTVVSDTIEQRTSTVGRVQPHVRAKLINPAGEVVPIGSPGEICVAGYLVQKGYWNDVKQTRSATHADEEGVVWMHTGDEGIMDKEGYLKIVGRIKDLIIRGGENLFPVQIEDAMTRHSGILEAAAISVPDAKYGEVVGAWVARRDPGEGETITKDEVRKFVSEAMNPQNAPAWVWFLGEDGLPEELPKTASGKVMKHILREWSGDLAAKGVGRVASTQTCPPAP
ncbi:acetyl-CoA synthetase-like protein [Athelia psychrophila]|uniref:Acetyl-CoA synthetase-like protein n=1 Tax=Athelia psychrophila TaxID=1759441 RepID=A0A166DP02_9AGAM|nr:acetyl-CoA synthetase-like protein [Fibularhizoctonia sp. CBS 109695]